MSKQDLEIFKSKLHNLAYDDNEIEEYILNVVDSISDLIRAIEKNNRETL